MSQIATPRRPAGSGACSMRPAGIASYRNRPGWSSPPWM